MGFDAFDSTAILQEKSGGARLTWHDMLNAPST